jgi:hypothetical protein
MKNFAATSRYGITDNPLKFGEAESGDPAHVGEEWLGARVPVDLPVAEDDLYVRPRPGERPDHLAARVPGWREAFGDDASLLWWLILDLNGVVNPFAALDPKVALRCPTADRVADALGR